jgi:predicted nucleic acid-binding Zn ribbon protein
MPERRICPSCGREFAVPSPKTNKRYCSDPCRKDLKRKERRQGAFIVERR